MLNLCARKEKREPAKREGTLNRGQQVSSSNLSWVCSPFHTRTPGRKRECMKSCPTLGSHSGRASECGTVTVPYACWWRESTRYSKKLDRGGAEEEIIGRIKGTDRDSVVYNRIAAKFTTFSVTSCVLLLLLLPQSHRQWAFPLGRGVHVWKRLMCAVS